MLVHACAVITGTVWEAYDLRQQDQGTLYIMYFGT